MSRDPSYCYCSTSDASADWKLSLCWEIHLLFLVLKVVFVFKLATLLLLERWFLYWENHVNVPWGFCFRLREPRYRSSGSGLHGENQAGWLRNQGDHGEKRRTTLLRLEKCFLNWENHATSSRECTIWRLRESWESGEWREPSWLRKNRDQGEAKDHVAASWELNFKLREPRYYFLEMCLLKIERGMRNRGTIAKKYFVE